MSKIVGVFQVIAGVSLWALSLSLELTWVVFCFGTVIIGLLLLFFAPYVLLFPLALTVPANTLILGGLARVQDRKFTGLGEL